MSQKPRHKHFIKFFSSFRCLRTVRRTIHVQAHASAIRNVTRESNLTNVLILKRYDKKGMGLSSILFWFKSNQSKHFLYLKACVLHKFMITFRFAYVYPLANLCCRESKYLSHSLSRSMLFYQNLAFLSNIPLNTQTLYKNSSCFVSIIF